VRARDIPNLISVVRILLVGPVVWLLLEQRFVSALTLFVIAGLSDALDGYLAKRNGWESRLGSVLDPLADKLLMVCTYLALGWLALLPAWLVAAVIARDLIIVGGAVYYHVRIAHVEMAPTLISKANTLFQILLVFVVMVARIHALPVWLVETLVGVVLATTLASGLSYIWIWSRRARTAVQTRRGDD